jgi:hypothetical protein
MPHLLLLGDSIFDNTRYTLGEPDVISQVKALLPKDWKATLLAVDGSMTTEIPAQLAHVPTDASYLVLSVGGNNAIMNADILSAPANSTSQALEVLAKVSRNFEQAYREAVDACLRLSLPLTLCTIYNGCFPDADYQRRISTDLMIFNDAILRVAIERQLSVLDLRFVCSLPADYANPIEPSSIGGGKIARAIVNLVSPGQGTGARVVA